MIQQFYDHFDSILSPKQCGFRKGHSAQHCLMVMLKEFKESRDRCDEFMALFTDLSKTFDCIDQNVLITKLPWYRVTTESLNLIYRTQNANNSCSTTHEITYGVPQRFSAWIMNARTIMLIAMRMTPLTILVQKICLL